MSLFDHIALEMWKGWMNAVDSKEESDKWDVTSVMLNE